MIPESVKKKRKKLFSECRDLLLKINGRIQNVTDDNGGGAHVCECCYGSNVPDEKMTRIESGQWLCPACLKSFYDT